MTGAAVPPLQTLGLLARREHPAPRPLGHPEHRAAGAAPELHGRPFCRVARLLQHVLLGRDHVVDPAQQAPRPRPPGPGVDDGRDPSLLTFVERRRRQSLIGRVEERDVNAFEELRQSLDHPCVRHRLWQPDDRPGRSSTRKDDSRVLRGLIIGDPGALHALGGQSRHQDLGMHAGPARRQQPGRAPQSPRGDSAPAAQSPHRDLMLDAQGSPSPRSDSRRGRRGSPPSPSRSSRPLAGGSDLVQFPLGGVLRARHDRDRLARESDLHGRFCSWSGRGR